MGLLMASLLLAIAPALLQPALVSAQQIAISPPNPELGDTISVVINMPPNQATNTNPYVLFKQKQYPAFAIAPNRWRALLPTTPLDAPGLKQVQVVMPSGSQAYNVNLQNRSYPTQSIWLSPSKSSIEGTDHEFDRVDAFKKIVSPQKFWQGAFIRPSQGSVSTVFGVRRYYNGEFANDYYHRGVDYAAGTGSPVFAPAAGYVRLVGTVGQGFQLHGNTVGIDHGQGVLSIFIHLSRINVKEGDFVQPGQVIGAVGSTGISTGPHLHWGLYVNNEAVDPVPWRYDGIE
ncbi:M23 family metallopeptidase [Thalassoporum mexicanum]|uniref:M23 family metallopeptidase n=1 Tax=Thalassoporum mexicanum TaxID=3457544 RepID=UPI0012E9CF5B